LPGNKQTPVRFIDTSRGVYERKNGISGTQRPITNLSAATDPAGVPFCRLQQRSNKR
jgi:hypothetical protein